MSSVNIIEFDKYFIPEIFFWALIEALQPTLLVDLNDDLFSFSSGSGLILGEPLNEQLNILVHSTVTGLPRLDSCSALLSESFSSAFDALVFLCEFHSMTSFCSLNHVVKTSSLGNSRSITEASLGL